MDIVIPYRKNDSDELRYALRTIEKHLPHDKIWLIGDNPTWTQNIEHIPYWQTGSMYLNGSNIMNIACKHPDISNDFILTNDDIFILKTPSTLKYNRGTYTELLENMLATTHYRRMVWTKQALQGLGYDNPTNYELHIPMIINKAKYLEATRTVHNMHLHNKRSIYGNHVKYGGRKIKDVKIPSLDKLPTNDTFTSTTEQSFAHGKVGAMIKDKYRKKSAYEK